MKICRVEQPNGEFIGMEAPDPIAMAGEVLVRVRASGVNPLDTKIRGGLAAHAKQRLPIVAARSGQPGPAISRFPRSPMRPMVSRGPIRSSGS